MDLDAELVLGQLEGWIRRSAHNNEDYPWEVEIPGAGWYMARNGAQVKQLIRLRTTYKPPKTPLSMRKGAKLGRWHTVAGQRIRIRKLATSHLQGVYEHLKERFLLGKALRTYRIVEQELQLRGGLPGETSDAKERCNLWYPTGWNDLGGPCGG